MHPNPHRRLVALALVGLLLSSCVTTRLPPVSSAGAAFEPTPDEVELWNEARLEEVRLRENVALYEDPALESYLDGVAARLTPPAMAANPHLQYQVWVVDDSTLNAFAYPHGPLYVHTGLLARMENEDQLATVLGHEMSHVEYRHMLRYRRSLQNKQVALLTAAVAAEILLAGEEYHQWRDGDWGEAVLVSVLGDVIVGLGLQLAFLASVNGYGRDLETEADHGGFRKLAAAGYDPAQAPRLYEILLEGSGGDDGRAENFFFGSHPRLTERIANARAWVDTHPTTTPAPEGAPGTLPPSEGDRVAAVDGTVGEQEAPDAAVVATLTEVPRSAGTTPSGEARVASAALPGTEPPIAEAVSAEPEPATAAPTKAAPAKAAPAMAANGVLVGDDVHVGSNVTVGEGGATAAAGTGTALGPAVDAGPTRLRGEPIGRAPFPLPRNARSVERTGHDATGEEDFRWSLQPVVVHEAWKNLDAGYLDLAESFTGKALDWNASDPHAHHVLGVLRLVQAGAASDAGDPEGERARLAEARSSFLEAVRLDPDLPGPHRELGFLYYDDGLLQDACRELGFYLDLSPDAPDATRVDDYLHDLQSRGAC